MRGDFVHFGTEWAGSGAWAGQKKQAGHCVRNPACSGEGERG